MKIAVHSFKGGTGKSTFCVNMAILAALEGKCIGVMDADLTAAGLHILFSTPPVIKHTLNDVLWGRCRLNDAVIDISDRLRIKKGKLYFLPASMESSYIVRVINEGYDPIVMSEIIRAMVDVYKLDFLFIDTHPGISSDILLTLVTCDSIILCSRYDKQDLGGAVIALDMIGRFGKRAEIVLNMVSPELSAEKVKEEAEKTFGRPIVATIPFYPDLFSAGSAEILALKRPDHPFCKEIENILRKISEA